MDVTNYLGKDNTMDVDINTTHFSYIHYLIWMGEERFDLPMETFINGPAGLAICVF